MRLKKSSLVTKLIVLAFAVYATVTLLSLQSKITSAESQQQSLEEQVAAVSAENQRLQEAVGGYNEESDAEQIAREKLGLVSKGEMIFYDVNN